VVQKTFLLHDECISYYPSLGFDSHSTRLLAHCIPPSEGTLKLNIDGSFLEDFGCLGVGVGVHNHDGDWITSFSHYEVGGDAFLAYLRAIQIDLDFCSKNGYVNIICESDCLEAVDLIIVGSDHTLHTYAIDILHIRDDLHGNANTTLMHVLREQIMCADFMAKEGSHAIRLMARLARLILGLGP